MRDKIWPHNGMNHKRYYFFHIFDEVMFDRTTFTNLVEWPGTYPGWDLCVILHNSLKPSALLREAVEKETCEVIECGSLRFGKSKCSCWKLMEAMSVDIVFTRHDEEWDEIWQWCRTNKKKSIEHEKYVVPEGERKVRIRGIILAQRQEFRIETKLNRKRADIEYEDVINELERRNQEYQVAGDDGNIDLLRRFHNL